MMNKTDIKSFTLKKMEDWFLSLNEKKFHATQVFKWLYDQKVKSFDEMTNISKSLRQKLNELAYISEIKVDEKKVSFDETIKVRYLLDDGEKIESVLIPEKERLTLCISSQVGCAIGCKFCLTGTMGFKRNLTVSEIINQVMQSQEIAGTKITNIVFMGMGEPLLNLDNVADSCNILLEQIGLNFSRYKITVSTSGIVPNIAELKKRADVRIAISLNSSTNEQRDYLIPINKKWNMEELISAVKEAATNDKESITVEYVMIKGINDSLDDAKRLRELVKDLKCKINLIPFNPHSGSDFQPPSEETVDKFHNYLYQKGEQVLYRRSRGKDIGAACGQLVVK